MAQGVTLPAYEHEPAEPAGIGVASPRIDGRAKVTGTARYGSDIRLTSPAHAALRTSSIARGRITAIDESAARAVPGVMEILTYKTVGQAIDPGKTFDQKGYMGTSIAPLASDRIQHDGQIVALVVADTHENAQEAANLLKISYAEETPSATFESRGLDVISAEDAAKKGGGSYKDPKIGDAAAAYAAAPVKVEGHYETPPQHHNPIELFTTTCAWEGPKLTVWESSQNVYGFKNGLAEQLKINADDIHIISPFIGGAFGSRGSLTQRTAIVALAARRLNRPVSLEATRADGFTIATYRAETRHHVKLAASRDGKLLSLTHEGWEITSRPDDYKVAGTDASTRIYACPNIDSKVWIVHGDRNTPGFMRAPAETPYQFALESAMDELAYALKMDPIELRRINDTQVEPIKGLPYTSRHLVECLDAGAKAFGWSKRNPEPGSMRDGDWLIGYGVSSTLYPTLVAPAAARVTLSPAGLVKVQSATHEIGNGVYTALAITAADKLGIGLDKITVEVGDSDLPPAPVAGGSNSTASVCTVVAKACEDIRDRIAKAAVADDGPFKGMDPSTLTLKGGALKAPNGASEKLVDAIARASSGAIEAYAENIPHGAPPTGMRMLYKGVPALSGGTQMKDRIQFAFGAQFVELRINARTREIRVPRMVGAFAAGRIVNPTTAKSQLMGGMIWGLSSALFESTEIDHRAARYTNTNLADYLMPVNADIGSVEVIMLPEQDTQINDLGIKGIGEIGIVGMNAAVANAVFHATGERVRKLPILIDNLLM
jgi:xanthine dehydrogenase YagR molybdenum-binding subunit